MSFDSGVHETALSDMEQKMGEKVVFDPEFASCVRKSDEVGLWIFRCYKMPTGGHRDLGDLVVNVVS